MDRVEQGDRRLRLVGLELADQVQPHVRDDFRADRRPFLLRLLHAILAEHALAGGDQAEDRDGGLGLGDGDQGHLVRLAARQQRRLADPPVDLVER